MTRMNRSHLSVDKSAFSVANLGDETEDKAYWRGYMSACKPSN